MLFCSTHQLKIDSLLENSTASNSRQKDSVTIVRLFNRYVLGQGGSKDRIKLGNAHIAYASLTSENITCSLNQIKLTWWQRRFFIPVDIKLANGISTRVLINKNSFLKNYEMTKQQKVILCALFHNWNENSLSIINKFIKKIDIRVLPNPNIARQELKKIGSSKKSNSTNENDTDLMVRTVMRYPSAECRQLLYRLHKALREKLQNQNDEALLWLLGGTSKYARGGFRSVEELRSFLEKPSESIHVSRLITGLETLLPAMGYRALRVDWAEPPFEPVTKEQKVMYRLCSNAKSYFPPRSAKSYPDKEYCINRDSSHELANEFQGSLREDLSDASDSESDIPANGERLPRAKFYKTHQNAETWVHAAKRGNISVRLGVSGTVGLSLAVAEMLLKESDPNTEVTQKELELLIGAIFIPTYVRGDYHSIAETISGAQHYLAYRQQCKKPVKAVLSPQEAFGKGLELLTQAVDTPYKDLLGDLSENLLRNTQYVPYTYPSSRLQRIFLRMFRGKLSFA